MRRTGFSALLACVGAMMLLPSCAKPNIMRGEIEALQKIADQAERNGAVRCAPRELAMAKAHLKFALLELEEGFMSRAVAHLDTAQPNVHAAYDLSPPQVCAERGFVQAKPGDKDGDGYLDPEDKCPDEPETWNLYEDQDGCPDDPDTDKDGIPDSKDSCVMDPEDKDSYLDEDGCPEPDNDLDGIVDDKDKSADGKSCANDPEDPDGYEDADGCPEPDNDQDKVVDNDDMCPNEPGEAGGDKPGCPKKPALAIITDTEIKILQQIHFEFDKDKIRKESFPIIDAVSDILKQKPNVKVEVQGHTDNKGKADYNLKLSDRRANSVMKALVARGIAPDRLRAKGYGMNKPIVPNDTEQNRALNRRVQFVRIESETH